MKLPIDPPVRHPGVVAGAVAEEHVEALRARVARAPAR
ncbi:hypothetical protein J2S66_001425 [Saccharothrix longispora]|uniref:Uncharacterized protein n=1 Tax=Saccharothrix longispora TaxID=33920 RepID=A0ABU1PQW1_9PSEU|nr:hypothetical protein [Saccharothrix longispora]